MPASSGPCFIHVWCVAYAKERRVILTIENAEACEAYPGECRDPRAGKLENTCQVAAVLTGSLVGTFGPVLERDLA